MIDTAYVVTMARYNRWQNENLYGAASGLNDMARRLDRGAFFGSIHGTLCHLLWGDRMWMHRFADVPRPEGTIPDSRAMVDNWEDLCTQRRDFDAVILDWAAALDEGWLDEDMTWVSSGGDRQFTMPRTLLVTHFFNHQTHHRGQVHAMLTAAGARPDDTDLIFMPDPG
jgi:uncharacterized damage-inducible protein DinB